MKGKLFILLAACALAMLLSCSDNTKADNSQPIENKSKLFVTAQDAREGKFLDAKATLRSTGETINLTSSGKESFTVPNGDYRVLVEKEGYATAEVNASVGSNMKPSVHIATNAHVNVPLYPTTASLSGSLVYRNINGKDTIAEGVVVRIIFTAGDLVTRVMYDTTDAAGNYSFENLPAVGTEYLLQTLASVMKDGSVLEPGEANTLNHPLLGGSNADYGKQNVDGEFFEASNESKEMGIASYKEVIEVTDTIKITFRDDINPASIDNNTLDFYNPYDDAYDVIWGKNTLTLIPVSGEWTPTELTIIIKGVKFVKAQGKTHSTMSAVVNIREVDLSEKRIVNFINQDSILLTADRDYAEVWWDNIKGATEYELYVAKKGTNKFNSATFISPPNKDKDTIKSTVYFGKEIEKDTLVFRVLAKNSRSKTALSDTLLVYDKIGPNFRYIDLTSKPPKQFHEFSDLDAYFKFFDKAADSSLNALEFSRTYRLRKALTESSARPVTNPVAIGLIRFSEKMDTSKTPTYTVTSTGGANPESKLKFSFKWSTTEEDLEVYVVTVEPGTITPGPNANVDAVYSIGDLFDKAGNAFSGTYGTAEGSKSKGTVDIRFAMTIKANPCEGTEVSSADCADHCDVEKTDPNCQTWACDTGDRYDDIVTGVSTEYCQKFCNGKDDISTCITNWPCELISGNKTLTNAGGNQKRLNDCKKQCVGADGVTKFKPAYCSAQTWTCGVVVPTYDPVENPGLPDGYTDFGGGFGPNSPECNKHCEWGVDELGIAIPKPFPAGASRRECLANRCLSSNALDEVSCKTFCQASAANADIQSDFIIGDGVVCKTYWGCELGGLALSGAGFGGPLCRTQCLTYNNKDYCGDQGWTCGDATNGYGVVNGTAYNTNTDPNTLLQIGIPSKNCGEYCMKTLPVNPNGGGYNNETCMTKADEIFSNTQPVGEPSDLLKYCRLFGIAGYKTVDICKDTFNDCQISTAQCPTFCNAQITAADIDDAAVADFYEPCLKNKNPNEPVETEEIFTKGGDAHKAYCQNLAKKGVFQQWRNIETYTACMPTFSVCNDIYAGETKAKLSSQCASRCRERYDWTGLFAGNTPGFVDSKWAQMPGACTDNYKGVCKIFGSEDGQDYFDAATNLTNYCAQCTGDAENTSCNIP